MKFICCVIFACLVMLSQCHPMLRQASSDENACWPEIRAILQRLVNVGREFSFLLEEMDSFFQQHSIDIHNDYMINPMIQMAECFLAGINSYTDLVNAAKHKSLVNKLLLTIENEVGGAEGIRSLISASQDLIQLLEDMNFPRFPIENVGKEELRDHVIGIKIRFPDFILSQMSQSSAYLKEFVRGEDFMVNVLTDSTDVEDFIVHVGQTPEEIPKLYLIGAALPFYKRLLPILNDLVGVLEERGWFEFVHDVDEDNTEPFKRSYEAVDRRKKRSYSIEESASIEENISNEQQDSNEARNGCWPEMKAVLWHGVEVVRNFPDMIENFVFPFNISNDYIVDAMLEIVTCRLEAVATYSDLKELASSVGIGNYDTETVAQYIRGMNGYEGIKSTLTAIDESLQLFLYINFPNFPITVITKDELRERLYSIRNQMSEGFFSQYQGFTLNFSDVEKLADALADSNTVLEFLEKMGKVENAEDALHRLYMWSSYIPAEKALIPVMQAIADQLEHHGWFTMVEEAGNGCWPEMHKALIEIVDVISQDPVLKGLFSISPDVAARLDKVMIDLTDLRKFIDANICKMKAIENMYNLMDIFKDLGRENIKKAYEYFKLTWSDFHGIYGFKKTIKALEYEFQILEDINYPHVPVQTLPKHELKTRILYLFNLFPKLFMKRAMFEMGLSWKDVDNMMYMWLDAVYESHSLEELAENTQKPLPMLHIENALIPTIKALLQPISIVAEQLEASNFFQLDRIYHEECLETEKWTVSSVFNTIQYYYPYSIKEWVRLSMKLYLDVDAFTEEGHDRLACMIEKASGSGITGLLDQAHDINQAVYSAILERMGAIKNDLDLTPDGLMDIKEKFSSLFSFLRSQNLPAISFPVTDVDRDHLVQLLDDALNALALKIERETLAQIVNGYLDAASMDDAAIVVSSKLGLDPYEEFAVTPVTLSYIRQITVTWSYVDEVFTTLANYDVLSPYNLK